MTGPDLAPALRASLQALLHDDIECVPQCRLPTDEQLAGLHAQLERLCRDGYAAVQEFNAPTAGLASVSKIRKETDDGGLERNV